MKHNSIFRGLISVELGLLIGILGAVFALNASKAAGFYLYEFIGVLMASIITTYGIYKMHDIT